MNTKYLYIILVLLGITVQGFSQSGLIRGRVFDKFSNESLPFVNVIILNTTTGTTTDLDGNFSITGLQPGFYQLTVSYLGYNKGLSAEVQVTNSNPVYLEIALEPSDQQIEEVNVVATRYTRKEESPVSLRTIGVQQIENNPGSNRDISKVIQSLPGIGATVSFRNDIIVRGGGSSESRFYLDGVEIPNLNHFATQGSSGGPVGIINADFVSGVNYYSGAFPANRGNALSGVFEFTQKDGNKDKLSFSGVVGASDLALTLDGPVGDKTSFIFSARQSYLQFLFNAIGLPFLPTFNDFQMKVRSRIDEKNEIIFVGLGAIDRFKLNLGIENPTEEQQYILDYLPVNEQWNYTNGLVYKHYRKNSYQTYVLSRNMLNNTSYKYRNNDDSNENNKILDYVSQEIENKFRFENNTRYKSLKVVFGAGAEYAKYSNNTTQAIFVQNQLINLKYNTYFDMYKWFGFAQVSKNFLSDRLVLSAGLRSDATNYSSTTNNLLDQLSPRFSASYFLTKQISANFNTGIYYQLPAYTTLGFKDNNGTLINKQNNLKYIQAKHIIGGFEYNPAPAWRLTLEGFYKLYDNYPVSKNDSINLANKDGDFGVIGAEEVYSNGQGRAYGVELFNQYSTKNGFSSILSYTYVISEFKNTEGKYIPSTWDNRHILTISMVKAFKKGWNVGAKWRYAGGKPYTPYNLEVSELVTAWEVQGRAYFDYSRINAERLPAFHQLDVRVDKKFNFKSWYLSVYVDIQNAYNFKAVQPEYLVKSYDEQMNPIIQNPEAPIDQQRYQLKALESLSGTVLPTLGIMIRF